MAISQRFFSTYAKLSNSSSISINNLLKLVRSNKKSKVLYRRSTHPTSVPLSKIFNNNFPLSVNESYDDYKNCDPLKFQHELLSLLPFYPNADARGRTSEVLKIPIDSKGNYINEFVIYPPNKNKQEMNHLILVHGYGAGLGFYFKNFNQLATKSNWCIHAIDLFGYGCSSRPKFHPNNLQQVEDWFHNSFASYMRFKNLNKDNCIVVAHSMGAYLLSTFGIKQDSNFCKKLICVSPGAVIKHRKPVTVPKYFKNLWEKNISPFTLVRKAGPLGSKLVSGWSSRRFANLPIEESQKLHRYSYGIFQSPGSGEYMLNYLLEPGADARHPLIERGIHKIKCKVSWWFGSHDWMDSKGGDLCSKIINNYNNQDLSDVRIIENSGHHIYLDNIDKFNTLLLQEMD